MSTQIIWINNHYGNTDHHGPLSLKTRFSNQKLLKNRIQYKAEKEIREALSPLNENGGEVEKKPRQSCYCRIQPIKTSTYIN